ncbi:uncharacterized protein LOC135351616 isoform X2 [Halichondria panicea]|uniref:uncharacterized protein LOC135351616 isoform X2 n=1 Tax=Halichondria panicea TaxID=6063 RepID=UPI00312B76D5
MCIHLSTPEISSDGSITTAPNTAAPEISSDGSTTTAPNTAAPEISSDGSTTTAPNTAAPPSGGTGGGDSSLPIILGGVVGVLVFVVLLMVGVFVLVVCIRTRKRSTDKWKPEVVSERQLAEGSQRGVINNGILSTGDADASINYEGEYEYSYIDPEDIRILARNPIVSQDKTDKVATSTRRSGDGSEMATSAPLTRKEMHYNQVPTADNICYGSTIPRGHSDQVPTSDDVAYGSAA